MAFVDVLNCPVIHLGGRNFRVQAAQGPLRARGGRRPVAAADYGVDDADDDDVEAGFNEEAIGRGDEAASSSYAGRDSSSQPARSGVAAQAAQRAQQRRVGEEGEGPAGGKEELIDEALIQQEGDGFMARLSCDAEVRVHLECEPVTALTVV